MSHTGDEVNTFVSAVRGISNESEGGPATISQAVNDRDVPSVNELKAVTSTPQTFRPFGISRYNDPSAVIDDHALSIRNLFVNNAEWAERKKSQDPEFFEQLSIQQSPEYLWIGCADSRVPANVITGLEPGEVFVHRNVANVVGHTDFNCIAVTQFAVDCLKVKHIIVCGHYGCGGVFATMKGMRLGLVDNWLRHVDDVQQKHKSRLEKYEIGKVRGNHLCELNVIEQVMNLCQSTIVRDAWDRGQPLTVHGLIYGMSDGLLRDLNMSSANLEEAHKKYNSAINMLPPEN